ncbi:unnamed protein product, partial [Coregonus sp. 'balchen']
TADSVISVSHTRDREHLSISCRLRGNDTVSQINWEMISSPNHTTTKLKLGTFHPMFDRTIACLYGESDLSKHSDLRYHENPEGPPIAMGVKEEPPQQPPLPSPPQPQPQGFDPSKLYAKIKLDLLYGRLWKAYQGTATAWGPTTQHGPQHGPQQVAEPGPQKLYFLLGEHWASQREEPEESILQLEPKSQPELRPEHQPTLEGREEPVTEPETESELNTSTNLDPGTQMEE